MIIIIIYKITNKVNNKIYIGQTINTVEIRFSAHKRSKKTIMGRAINKYGIENFDVEVIDKANSIDELNNKEIYYIKEYNSMAPNGYNLCYGGGSTSGYTHKEESKALMSKNRKGKYTGEDNHFFGKTHSDEQIAKWKRERSGRKLTEEHKKNIGIAGQVKVINLDTNEVFDSIKEASEHHGLKATHITRVCKGKRKTTGGFRWGYYNDDRYKSIPSEA